jgi:hypothetical protein
MIKKVVLKDSISFTYLCDTLESLLFEGSSLSGSLEKYCEETNKEIRSKSYVTENKNEFILEVSVSKK